MWNLSFALTRVYSPHSAGRFIESSVWGSVWNHVWGGGVSSCRGPGSSRCVSHPQSQLCPRHTGWLLPGRWLPLCLLHVWPPGKQGRRRWVGERGVVQSTSIVVFGVFVVWQQVKNRKKKILIRFTHIRVHIHKPSHSLAHCTAAHNMCIHIQCVTFLLLCLGWDLSSDLCFSAAHPCVCVYTCMLYASTGVCCVCTFFIVLLGSLYHHSHQPPLCVLSLRNRYRNVYDYDDSSLSPAASFRLCLISSPLMLHHFCFKYICFVFVFFCIKS